MAEEAGNGAEMLEEEKEENNTAESKSMGGRSRKRRVDTQYKIIIKIR